MSTDKANALFPSLQKQLLPTKGPKLIATIFADIAFKDFGNVSVLPLIYREKEQKCNILIFDFPKARANTKKVILEVAPDLKKSGKPVCRLEAKTAPPHFAPPRRGSA